VQVSPWETALYFKFICTEHCQTVSHNHFHIPYIFELNKNHIKELTTLIKLGKKSHQQYICVSRKVGLSLMRLDKEEEWKLGEEEAVISAWDG